MGRHTKRKQDDPPPAAPGRSGGRLRWVTGVPLLPVIAGLGAVGVVATAVSTSQISLNFAGDAPSHEDSAQGQAQAPAIRDQQVPGRDGAPRTSRGSGTDYRQGTGGEHAAAQGGGVTLAFRTVARSRDGFRGSVTIANRGRRAVDGWLLKFKIPNARVLSVGNAVLERSGPVAAVRNPRELPTIGPGQTVRVSFTARGAAAEPSACRFNRARCSIV